MIMESTVSVVDRLYALEDLQKNIHNYYYIKNFCIDSAKHLEQPPTSYKSFKSHVKTHFLSLSHCS